jgi:hypothetical protein
MELLSVVGREKHQAGRLRRVLDHSIVRAGSAGWGCIALAALQRVITRAPVPPSATMQREAIGRSIVAIGAILSVAAGWALLCRLLLLAAGDE